MPSHCGLKKSKICYSNPSSYQLSMERLHSCSCL